MSQIAGSSSISRVQAWAISSASARVRPRQIATISPTKRTLSPTSGGYSECLKPRAALSATIGFSGGKSPARNTRSRILVGNADGDKAAVSNGASQECGFEHAGKLHVAEVFSASVEETAVLDAKHRRTDAFCPSLANSPVQADFPYRISYTIFVDQTRCQRSVRHIAWAVTDLGRVDEAMKSLEWLVRLPATRHVGGNVSAEHASERKG